MSIAFYIRPVQPLKINQPCKHLLHSEKRATTCDLHSVNERGLIIVPLDLSENAEKKKKKKAARVHTTMEQARETERENERKP